MSDLPSFELDSDVRFVDEERGHTHARKSEKQINQTEHVCNICGKDCKTPGGLGSHKKHAHEVNVKDILDNDVLKVLAEFDPTNSMIYSSDLDLWVSKQNVKVPNGFVVHSINEQIISAKKPDDNKRYNTHSMILVRESKLEEEK